MSKQDELVSVIQNLAANIETGKYGSGNNLDALAIMDDMGQLADDVEDILEEDIDEDDLDDLDDDTIDIGDGTGLSEE